MCRMTGARPSIARGGSEGFAKSWGCCNASTNFAPAGRCLKVSRAEASELNARCHLSHEYLFVQVCLCKKGRKPTTFPRPLCSLRWGSSIRWPGGCISAGFSSVYGARLIPLMFSGDGGAEGHHALLTTVQDVAHCSSPLVAAAGWDGWSCCHQHDALTMVRKKPSQPLVPRLGQGCGKGPVPAAPSQHCW